MATIEYQREWQDANREKVRSYGRKAWRKKRLAAIENLGGQCVHCGTDDARVLEIDHVDGGRNGGRTATSTESAALGETAGLQLLCANCHAIKTWENGDHRV